MSKILFGAFLHGIRYYRRAPYSALILSAHLKSAGHEVFLEDLSDPARLLDTAKRVRPDILAFTVRTPYLAQILRVNSTVKERIKVLSVMGGPHPTFYPGMIKERDVDAICLGEGDTALVHFANRAQEKGDLSKVPNFIFKSDSGELTRNPLGPPVSDLDGLPFPDWDLLADFPGQLHAPSKAFFSSRGCPFNCSYCHNYSLKRLYGLDNRHFTRRMSVSRFFSEIEWVRSRFGLKFVHIEDDTFNITPSWLDEFFRRYEKEIGLPYKVNLRADLMTDDIADGLQQSGCHSVSMALEAGDRAVRRRVLNRNMTFDQYARAAESLKRRGILVVTQNILGVPGTTLEDDLETLKKCIRVRPCYAIASLFQPLPGITLMETGNLDVDRAVERYKAAGNCDFFKNYFIDRDDKIQLLRLRHLFALMVGSSLPVPLVKWLIRIPLGPLYKALDTLYLATKAFVLFSYSPGISGGLRTLVKEVVKPALMNMKYRQYKGTNQ